MSDGGSNRLPYNQSQRSSQQQQSQQQQQLQPHQQTAAAQQMGGYMMHQQPTWGGVQQAAQYGQAQQQQQSMYQQQLYQQQLMQQQQQQQHYGGAAAASAGGIMPQYHQGLMAMDSSYMNQQQAVPIPPRMQPRPGRLPADRPIIKLSVGLIETYKDINKVRGDKIYSLAFSCCRLQILESYGLVAACGLESSDLHRHAP